ncbi:MAG: ABC transporter ATP-binding protein, partial [Clostridiales bacterium]|nr:ABC transporter ATP-binding protein [Clostridiales bacterium]
LRLSIIFLIVAPLVSLVIYLIMKLSVPYYRVRQRMLDRVSRITRENLSGARVIRAFSKQEHEINRFSDANNQVADIAINVGKISAFLNPATFAILNMAILAILWFGGLRVEAGNLTQGEVIAFVNYMTQISIALVVVANLVVIFTKASASARRINQVFETLPSVKEGEEGISVQDQVENMPIDDLQDKLSNKNQRPLVSLDKVSFAYFGSDEYALDDISFDINEGEIIGIIGGTGSGKSTLINLLPRFYDVDKGEIRIDGIPVKEYSFDRLRSLFGIVPQKAVLFSGSISDNLRYSNEKASIDDIERAIDIAQAKDFVDRLSDGYDSQINQGGRNLSGGQRQRLTIARALVRKPRILILDDSSSALDYATDARLRESIGKNCEGTTVIIVSQRANSIKHADQIIVLDDGRMVGIGKHDELYQTCQIYSEICDSQVK